MIDLFYQIALSNVFISLALAIAAVVANRLGLKIAPTPYTTSAHLSPLVCWARRHLRADEEICCRERS
jgi:hypothetical protein